MALSMGGSGGSSGIRCPLCRVGSGREFTSLPGVPAHVGVLWSSPEAARGCPKGDLTLAFCDACGFVWNLAFDPAVVDYTQDYDNSLHASAVFRAFEKTLAQHLVRTYGLHGRDLVEIGCGNGHFLSLLCQEGDNRGTGYEPGYDPARAGLPADERATIVPHPLSGALDAEFVVCRQVLEHIASPRELPTTVQTLAGERPCSVYFEVPNALLLLRDSLIWELVYEHCSYFTAGPLEYLFETLGFADVTVGEWYDDQFLGVEARWLGRPATNPPTPPGSGDTAAIVAAFADHLEKQRRVWSERLGGWAAANERVVVWGGGARAVGFASFLGLRGEVECFVDINPRKQGTFLAGTAHPIVAPDRLLAVQPDHVVVLNPVYRAEVETALAELGLAPDVVVP